MLKRTHGRSLGIALFVLLVLVPLFVRCKTKEPFESIPIYRPKAAERCRGFRPVYVYYPYDEITGNLL
jgi:hypothetical protein